MPVNPVIPPKPSTQVRPAGGTRQRSGPKSGEEEFRMPSSADEILVKGRDQHGKAPGHQRGTFEGSGHRGERSTESDPVDNEQSLGRNVDITV